MASAPNPQGLDLTTSLGKTKEDSKGYKALQALQEQVTCSICLDNYTNPKLLQCHHTFCQLCLEPLQKKQQEHLTLTCPTCRQVTPVPPNGVAGLQADFKSNRFLEIVEEDDSQKVSEIIENEILSLEHMEKSLIANLEAFDTRKDEISSQVVTIETDIHEKFEHFYVTLKAKEEDLVQQLQKIKEAKLENLEAERHNVEATQAKLSSYFQLLREGLMAGNLNEVLQSMKVAGPFDPDMQGPSTRADITLKVFDDFGSWCRKKFKVFCSEGPPDPCKCYISTSPGKGVDSAIADKTSTAYLNVMDTSNQPSKLDITVKSELISEITSKKTEVKVEKFGATKYKLTYQPTIKGFHQLHIVAKGQHIPGSLFSVIVKSSTTKKPSILPLVTLEGVHSPQGIAVTKRGELVITELNKHCVTVLNLRGKRLRSFGTEGKNQGQFQYPCGVTVDDEDNILVADRHNNNIQKFTINGEYISTVGSELGDKPHEFAYPRGIAFIGLYMQTLN